MPTETIRGAVARREDDDDAARPPTAIATTMAPTAGALALRPDQQQWNPLQIAAFEQIGIDKAPVADQLVFLHVCQRTRLDPFSRQIYMIGRKDRETGRLKYTIQTGIDGFRAIADERPQYRGQTAPQWCGADGKWRDVWVGAQPPVAARVGIIRDDWPSPAWGIARFAEFNAGNSMWRGKPAHMIAKCAEALGFRKAFPQHFAGILSDEEADRDDMPTREHERIRTVVEQVPPPAAGASAEPEEPATRVTGGTEVPAEDPPAEPAPATEGGGGGAGPKMKQPQQRKIFALLREVDIGDRDRFEFASDVIGRQVGSYGDLSEGDASAVITALEQLRDALADGDDATGSEADGEPVDTQ
jgi:phage recombination protein Bet